MELLQLRYFLEVAESEHVTHSAQKLRVSQPSLTQAISRLERELGVQLFEPEGRGIRLTEAGRFYSKRIAKAVGESTRRPASLRGSTKSAARLCA